MNWTELFKVLYKEFDEEDFPSLFSISTEEDTKDFFGKYILPFKKEFKFETLKKIKNDEVDKNNYEELIEVINLCNYLLLKEICNKYIENIRKILKLPNEIKEKEAKILTNKLTEDGLNQDIINIILEETCVVKDGRTSLTFPHMLIKDLKQLKKCDNTIR